MIFDAHTHTEFSSDSKMNGTDAFLEAERQGIGLIFTEHYDFDYRQSVHFKDMDFLFEPEEYFKRYEPLRGERLLLGIEVGMTPGSIEANRKIVAENPFDQVIGSIHAIDGLDIYYPEFYKGKTKEEAFDRYFRAMAEMVKENPFIDVLGHIDYICRYAPYDDKDIDYAVHRETIDEVLKNVLETDTIMELNTRRLWDKTAAERLMPIYKRYRDMGGRYVTVGSDAHVEEHIGANFKEALDFAAQLSLQPVYFEKRTMKCE